MIFFPVGNLVLLLVPSRYIGLGAASALLSAMSISCLILENEDPAMQLFFWVYLISAIVCIALWLKKRLAKKGLVNIPAVLVFWQPTVSIQGWTFAPEYGDRPLRVGSAQSVFSHHILANEYRWCGARFFSLCGTLTWTATIWVFGLLSLKFQDIRTALYNSDFRKNNSMKRLLCCAN